MKSIHELLDQHEVYCVPKDDPVLAVAQKMTELNVGAVSVLDGQKLVADLLLHHLHAKGSEIQMMRAFIHYLPPSAPAAPGH